jgi:hypothetical protein
MIDSFETSQNTSISGSVSERDLARLVDHKDIDRVTHRLAREQPRCAGDELHLLARRGKVAVVG